MKFQRKYQPEEFKKKVCEYIDAHPYPEIITVGGLCLHLDMTYSGFRGYREREDTANICRYARMEIENRLNVLALKNKVNVGMAIFNLKNNFGWSDTGMKNEDAKPDDDKLNIRVIVCDGRKQEGKSK